MDYTEQQKFMITEQKYLLVFLESILTLCSFICPVFIQYATIRKHQLLTQR